MPLLLSLPQSLYESGFAVNPDKAVEHHFDQVSGACDPAQVQNREKSQSRKCLDRYPRGNFFN
jgi:hypothetical protein